MSSKRSLPARRLVPSRIEKPAKDGWGKKAVLHGESEDGGDHHEDECSDHEVGAGEQDGLDRQMLNALAIGIVRRGLDQRTRLIAGPPVQP